MRVLSDILPKLSNTGSISLKSCLPNLLDKIGGIPAKSDLSQVLTGLCKISFSKWAFIIGGEDSRRNIKGDAK